MSVTTVDLLTRIEALEARLAAQAVEIERLNPPHSAGLPEPSTRLSEDAASDGRFSRRDWLLTGVAGLAATTLGATKAEALTRTTILSGAGSTTSYALAAVSNGAGGGEPADLVPPLSGNFYGAIGSITGTAATPPSSAGLLGLAYSSEGVLGASILANGVRGLSTSGSGVRGEIIGTSTQNGIAVHGVNNSTYTGGGPGAGGFGIYGASAKGHGLVGATSATGGAAIVGATNGVPGAYAAAFYGPVVVGGDFVVVGGAKSAAVPFPDGTHRQLYCVESPESWFEDFGTGELVDGCAEVAIEPGFGAVADMANYHVFLTAYGRDHLLYVARRTPKGFLVEVDTALAELKGLTRAALTGTFSWRVVAKRKDIAGPRLAVVTIPPEPVLPSMEPLAPVAPGHEDPPGLLRARRVARR